MSKGLIYLIGACVLGLADKWLWTSFSNPVAFCIAMTYIVILWFLGKKFGKSTYASKKSSE
jgi:hypothetical protein